MTYGFLNNLRDFNDKLTWLDTPPPALLNDNVKVWVFLQDDFKKSDNLPNDDENNLSLEKE